MSPEADRDVLLNGVVRQDQYRQMKACAFDYARPRDVSEAVSLLSKENSKAAAGTQSLGPMLNLRVFQPALLVDLRFIQELTSSSENKDHVTLGACVTHAQIEDGKVPDA